MENGDTKIENPPLNDPHQVWIGQPENQEVPETFGAVVVQLSQKGLVNALASSGDMDEQQVNKMATTLHRVVETKMERDFLETTPERIREMLCSDVSPTEFRAIRRRVYDTVVLGKGMNNSQVEEDELPVAARATVHDIEKVRTCTLVSMKKRFSHICAHFSRLV
jgi:membrane carboxypeptidase/penicillin-binding protein PbpC